MTPKTSSKALASAAQQKSGKAAPKPKKASATLVLLDGDYSGRDEMNLAGNPFALLQTSARNGQTYIRYEWERRLPNGRLVTASWEVNGHEKLGLPGPTEEKLYLVLLQLTREAGTEAEPWPRKVAFSRGEVIRRMGWSDEATAYRALRDSFARLQTVAIQADHTFWSARSKTFYETVGLGVLGDFAIEAEPRGRKGQNVLPLSWFEWESVLHTSIETGNVRNLALDFTLSLEFPTSRRLFRFIDMMRHATKPPRQEFTIGLMKLRDRMGMTNYKYASKVKEKMVSAHEELIERGYLTKVEYIKSRDGGEMVVYHFGEVKIASLGDQSPSPDEIHRNNTHAANSPGVESINVPGRPVKGPLRPVSDSGRDIYPNEAFAVFTALPEGERERLRQMARAEVEPAFWDRLERPDSPMALVLWEIVAREFPAQYGAQLEP